MSFLKSSGQFWKLILALAILAIGGGVIINQGFLYGPLGEDTTMLIVSCATGLAFVGFAWACLSIRCPRCHLRILWHAIRKQHLNKWLGWLLKFSECPSCGFRPGPEQ